MDHNTLNTTKSIHRAAAACGAATRDQEHHQDENQKEKRPFYRFHRLKDRGIDGKMVEALCAEQVKSACGFDRMVNPSQAR